MEGVLLLKSTSPSMCSPQDSSNMPLAAKEDSDLKVSPAASVMHATVAPPPPPLPPPPPPPPPPLLPTSFDSRDVQRRSMKRLNWDTIPSHNVVGKLNVWTSQRPQRDLVLDVRSMEELFSHVDKRASLRSSRVIGLRKCGSMDLIPQELRVTILHSKRSMNIGIFLRHFKRPVKEIIEDIRQGNWLRFGTGKLKELCKLLPEESEVKQLRSFSGNVAALPEADQFMVQLITVPGYEERLKTMVLREEFFPLMEEVKNSISVMTKAANELLDCDDLHSVIRLVLKAGNYMNAGGYSANAIGFRMASLLKLADTKANKPGMNLMHYVAKQAEDIDAELLTFPRQLHHIEMASRICKNEVITDFEGEVEKIKEVKLFSSRQPGLLQQLETFLLRAEAKIADMETSLRELNAASDAVAGYFCEVPATFKLEECCSIFNSFCKRFDTAVQENREREAAEQRHKRKESMRISVKRRSTVSCTGPELNSESSCLESALHNLLSSVPGGIARCRKNMLPPVEPLLSECSSQNAIKTSGISQESPEKRPVKMQKQGRQMSKLKDKEVEKMREVTRKVLDFQKCNDGNKVLDSPHYSEREQGKPATPSTPVPRTRDFFFANNGDVGSPWTILSPITCSQRDNPLRNRQARQRRISWTTSGEKPVDGVGKRDENDSQPNTCSQDSRTSPSVGSTSLPECLRRRVLSQGPVVRSASVDETMQSPGAGFRLGGLFQRSTSQRSYSSGSRTANVREDEASSKAGSRVEGQVSTSGFISFFRRIGGRSKPGDLEEQNFERSDTS